MLGPRGWKEEENTRAKMMIELGVTLADLDTVLEAGLRRLPIRVQRIVFVHDVDQVILYEARPPDALAGDVAVRFEVANIHVFVEVLHMDVQLCKVQELVILKISYGRLGLVNQLCTPIATAKLFPSREAMQFLRYLDLIRVGFKVSCICHLAKEFELGALSLEPGLAYLSIAVCNSNTGRCSPLNQLIAERH